MTTICIFCAKHTKLNVIRNGMTRLCKMKKIRCVCPDQPKNNSCLNKLLHYLCALLRWL